MSKKSAYKIEVEKKVSVLNQRLIALDQEQTQVLFQITTWKEVLASIPSRAKPVTKKPQKNKEQS